MDTRNLTFSQRAERLRRSVKRGLCSPTVAQDDLAYFAVTDPRINSRRNPEFLIWWHVIAATRYTP
jgi:hypothetical protein